MNFFTRLLSAREQDGGREGAGATSDTMATSALGTAAASALPIDEDPQVYSEAVRAFKSFLQPRLLDDAERRILDAARRAGEGMDAAYRHRLDLDELRRYDQSLAAQLLSAPLTYLRACEEALAVVVLEQFGRASEGVQCFVAVEGAERSFGRHLVGPRGLKSRLLGKLVCVEGIVTKASVVRPKLVRAVQFCPKTGKHAPPRVYRDATDLAGLPTPAVVPAQDEMGHALELEFGLCEYKNYQRLTIQEMPERAPMGQLPRSVDVVLENDLCDRVKPGDRVRASGVFRALGVVLGRSNDGVSGNFRTLLVCGSIQLLGREVGGLVVTARDLDSIKRVAGEPGAFERLALSLAPSIYGHDFIKRSILLLLLGGVERVLENGAHLRGDINLLMVGDPSTAKSQLLRFVLGVAPLAISTTGRGSTGVGLTAAVTSDPDTGERRLEAGAMVLADRGVVCIDEFDKMSDGDRVAIHEVMEQQTVTIAKAGVHASLNARCSVVAAANPIYGSYDRDLTPQRNVGLPDSLLSRFDLLFIVLDASTTQHDRAIADHVLRMHRYQRPGQEGKPISDADAGDGAGLGGGPGSRRNGAGGDEEEEGGGGGAALGGDDETSPVYQKFNPLLHGGYAEAMGGARGQPQQHGEGGLFSTEFVRKYVHYAKSRCKPELTAEAASTIAQEYTELRQEQAARTLPITPRCLETLIRLSSAHAKARLSPLVEEVDCKAAREILRFALYNETESADAKRRREAIAAARGEEEMPDGGGKRRRGGARGAFRRRARGQQRRRPSGARGDEEGKEEDSEDSEDSEKEEDVEEGEDEDEDDDDGDEGGRKRGKRVVSTQDLAEQMAAMGAEAGAEDDDVRDSPERFAFFKTVLNRLFRDSNDDEILATAALAAAEEQRARERAAWPRFTAREMDRMLESLENDNVFMYRDGLIFRV